MDDERVFKGVWIPAGIWKSTELTLIEKAILTEINSFSSADHTCYMTNEAFAKFCQCSEKTVSRAITKLIDNGYVDVVSFDGRHRELRASDFCLVCLDNLSMQGRQNVQADKSKCPPINIPIEYTDCDNKTDVPRGHNKRSKTEIDFDELPSMTESFETALRKWIKYRKEIKKPIYQTTVETLVGEWRDKERRFIVAVDYTIGKGWQGLREPEQNKTTEKRNSTDEFTRILEKWSIENDEGRNTSDYQSDDGCIF